mgnify:CR=1 FL=1
MRAALEAAAQSVIARDPGDFFTYLGRPVRLRLVEILGKDDYARIGEFDAASKAMEPLRELNQLGRMDAKIAELEQMLQRARGGATEVVKPAILK